MSFGERLKALLANKKISQNKLAAQMGISQAALSQFISGKNNPSMETIQKIAAALNVQPGELLGPAGPEDFNMTETGEELFPHPRMVRVPVFSKIRAGSGEMGFSDAEICDEMFITEEHKKQKYFVLRVAGDSMEPVLFDGEYAIFKPMNGNPQRDRDLCAVQVEGWAEWVVKYVKEDPSGMIQLISANKAYPVKEINPKVSPVTIKGIVIEAHRIRKFNK